MKKLFITSAILFLCGSFFYSCKKSQSSTTTTTTVKHGTGWTGTDNPAKVPQAVNIAGLAGASAPLPSKVDLTPFGPPIGDQGQTATCVGWSTGYYAKTISEAIANNYSQSNLGSATYEMSAKDLFVSIADNLKGSTDCKSGTQITYALDVLINSGVATMEVVPWDPNITDCSQSQVQASWNAQAANHKIVYYRTITSSVQGIKEQLAANNPVLMGIQVSNEFESYSGGVISSATGALGLHAQCIVGYDDNQGAAGAFHVANSWGTGWGEAGYYWIDYNTLVNQYISGGNVYYMATSSSKNNVTPPTTTTTSLVDIAAWVFSDASTYGNATDDPTNDPTARKMWLNIYNIGQTAVDPSSDWSYYYIYYNAFNANDYGIIFHDEFNTTIPANTASCANNDACIFNIAIPAGTNFGEVAFGTPEIYRNYFVPNNLNGYYYLVLVVDPKNVLNDVNRQNNIFYTTGQLPAAFINGVTNSYNPGAIHDTLQNTMEANATNLRQSAYNTSVGEGNRNAYTPQEIIGFVKSKYESGEIRQKINAMPHRTKKISPQIH
ncbi:MAG TPA: C1 family peptidase [Puia sp.]|nr:C1 family peptidase [Puia sp.]